MKDVYQSIKVETFYELKEKASKFLCFAFPIVSIEDFEMRLSRIRAEHSKATHHCYAYAVGVNREFNRANDDGEPSGTAGKPIYGQILSENISDVGIIVVRYYGGTKLGTSGLISAYKDAAKGALSIAEKVDKVLNDKFLLEFGFEKMGEVLSAVKSLDLSIIKKNFEISPELTIEIRQSESQERLIKLKALLLKLETERVNEETEIYFCKIRKI